jgi:hypothetical protein
MVWEIERLCRKKIIMAGIEIPNFVIKVEVLPFHGPSLQHFLKKRVVTSFQTSAYIKLSTRQTMSFN